jgi:hypothetical protein
VTQLLQLGISRDAAAIIAAIDRLVDAVDRLTRRGF